MNEEVKKDRSRIIKEITMMQRAMTLRPQMYGSLLEQEAVLWTLQHFRQVILEIDGPRLCDEKATIDYCNKYKFSNSASISFQILEKEKDEIAAQELFKEYISSIYLGE